MPTPRSTYRLQLHEKFTFRHLDEILEYLHELGISTIYAAPITMSAKGSNHGYDVIDPLRLNPAIGTEEELAALAARLKAYSMNWLQDIVPNHMAYDMDNPWLYDVLERGPQSPWYRFFDITPGASTGLLGDKLMAPFLGATLTECLQKGELTLQFTDTGFVIRYYDKDYPVAARLYRWICTVSDGYPAGLSPALDALDKALSSDGPTWKAAKTQWLQQMAVYAAWPEFVAARVQFFNQRIHLLESLLQGQYYVLTHHRLAATHINYRRFFTVNSLICLRMEDPDVFREYHSVIHRWYTRGWINGLRIDHIDGLAQPKQYLQSLKALFGEQTYVVAEKILTGDEKMPANWPLEGSTGYDFLAMAGQLLTDADGSRELLDFYAREVIDLPPYPTVVYERKLDYLLRHMGGELDNLMDLLTSLPLLRAAAQDKTRLQEALATWMAAFPVYRAYPDGTGGSAEDAAHFATALHRARTYRPHLLAELNYLDSLTRYSPAGSPAVGSSGSLPSDHRRHAAFVAPSDFRASDFRAQQLTFLTRLMQFTGPLAAKGIEDTTFYIYNPYIAHCEVGDTPAIAGIAPADFHRLMQDRQKEQPYSLNATSTHDTKRGEDSRIRLSFLSAIPQEWITAVKHWRQLNQPLVASVPAHPEDTHSTRPAASGDASVAPAGPSSPRPAPSPNDEYLIYQALLGGFPAHAIVDDLFRERFAGYLTKALREAGTETNYDDPDEAYEQQCQAFAAALLKPGSPFLEAFVPFAQTVIRQAAVYSLSLLLLKLTAPGIPDIYQGAELWEESFVDPDNRRPVDFLRRTTLLRELRSAETKDKEALMGFLHAHRDEGIGKLFTLYRTLQYRNSHPEVFSEGDYIPLVCQGPWLAFLRHHGDHWALIAVPLIRYGITTPQPLSLQLPADAPTRWINRFTGELIVPAASSENTGNRAEDAPKAHAAQQSPGATLSWPDGPGPWPVILLTSTNDSAGAHP
jgi:(1->4)-alpha-D-glucan 1-alpha-D-glucosylmutase